MEVKPFQQYTEAPQPGILVTNPPYGERISSKDLLGLYNMIGERLKHVFSGYKAWILSYKEECFDKIGLRPCEKIKLMNGSLECEFRCYEMFEGTNKEFKKALNRGRNDDYGKKRTDNRFQEKRAGRQERRFTSEHRNDDDFFDKRKFSDEKRPAKMRYRDNFDKKRFNNKKSFGNKKNRRRYDEE